ncbi:MAG: hypothetical protein H6574_07425 [Lewinellaceae bacterium]|nr:hypothetical protein [Saprospiraceae bacterium]MCB9330893.1 hypothetical protein [Lewinellaceae bacterium]
MKNSFFVSVLIVLFSASYALAQQANIQYYRPWDKDGINVFEPSKKAEQPEYTGFKIRIGGSFTQDFQSLNHENTDTSAANVNKLWALGSGFNLAMANLNLDMQIDDGIRVALENYMSARHHNEFWVKGGYIQFDKLPMFNSPQWFTDYVRVKIGHFQPNFGDMQFRRSDGGNTMFNPFVENLIFDAFTTEIGGEVYVFPADGFMGMVGMSSGFINGNVQEYTDAPAPVEPNEKKPSIFFKLAYDKTFNDVRFRLSGSLYTNPSNQRNTLYAGDRTGSHYFMVLEPASGTYKDNKDSGRFTKLDVANEVMAISINPFVKYKGLELFGDYQMIKGRTNAERNGSERDFNQIAVEGLYRFFKNESAYLGVRYIMASGTPRGYDNEIKIDRVAVAAGWFPTRNLLLKGEYVVQNYKDFPGDSIFYEGKFDGFMIEAVIGF